MNHSYCNIIIGFFICQSVEVFVFFESEDNHYHHYLMTYLGLSFREEHRPSTTVFVINMVLGCFCCIVPGHVLRLQSASVSRRRLFLFFLPCGFQDKAWRVVLDVGFLRVYPIQPNFFRLICMSIGSFPALFQSFSFVILLGHRMLKMLLRQVL